MMDPQKTGQKKELFYSLAALAVVAAYAVYLTQSLLFFKQGTAGGVRYVLLYLALGLPLLLLPRALHFHARSGKPVFAARAFHAFLFLSAVLVLKHADFSWNDFERKGFFLVLNHFARVTFFIYFVGACFGAGKIAMEKTFSKAEQDTGENFVLYFFTGATLLALASVAAGFLGLLNRYFALALMTPLVFYSGPSIFRAFKSLWAVAGGDPPGGKPSLYLNLSLLWLLAGVATVLVLCKGLYPGALNNDVWEHYLHYYREVLRTGSLGPNELWTHFYVSKGAGLFFLTGVLSDVFSMESVSLAFIFVTAVILFQMARKFTKDTPISLAAALFYLCLYDGDFFKHHAVLAGYIIFLVWGVTRLFSAEEHFKQYTFCGALVSFYLGFYQPIVFTLMGFFFLVLAAWLFLGKASGKKILVPLGLGVIGSLGMALAFGVNFAFTGLLCEAPMRFFWHFADKAKFLNKVGPSGIVYFLNGNSDMQTNLNYFNPEWARRIFKVSVLKDYFPLWAVVAGLLFVARGRARERVLKKEWAPALIFMACALVFGQVVQVGSLERLYTFTVFFSSFFAFVILHRVFISLPLFAKKAAPAVILLLLGATVFSRSIDAISPARWSAVLNYARGRLSFAGALQETDLFFSSKSIPLAAIVKFRKELGPEVRIFNLGYDPGPGYSFPGIGIYSEPSYTLGPDAETLFFGEPEAAKIRLKALGLNYFMLDIKNSLFTGVAFGKLFDNENFSRYFRVVSTAGETYLLSWREVGQEDNMPPSVAQLVDLRRAGSPVYPFLDSFRQDVTPMLRYFCQDGVMVGSYGEGINLADETARVLIQHMLGSLKVEVNRTAVAQSIESLRAKLKMELPRLIDKVMTEPMPPGGSLESQAVNGILWYVRSYMQSFYIVSYGAPLARLLLNCYSPFNDIYASKESFQQLLDLK